MTENPKPIFCALLVEGIPGIGKSTLVDALIRRHVDSAEQRKIRTLVHLTQGHTYGPIAPAEDAGTLTVDDNAKHLDHIISMMEWLKESVWYQTKPWCFVIIDTLHLTHCLRPGVLTWEHARQFDQRLAAIDCKLLLLQGSEQTIWDRTIKGREDTEFLTEYATKFGQTHREFHSHFLNEQTRFKTMFDESAMPKKMIQNDGVLNDIVDSAYHFWLE